MAASKKQQKKWNFVKPVDRNSKLVLKTSWYCCWPQNQYIFRLHLKIQIYFYVNNYSIYFCYYNLTYTKVNETLANFMLTLYLGTTSRLLVFGKTRTYHCFNGTRTKVMKLKRCLFQLTNREAPFPRDFPLLY